jgi:hypothetical protein
MQKFLIKTFLLSLICSTLFANTRYGAIICHQDNFHCLKVQEGQTWESLFSDRQQIDLLQRVNRMNIELRPGMTIAIPDHLEQLSIYDVSPFPRYIPENGEKTVFIDQHQLAWAAYNESGELIWWGPVSPGSGQCAKEQGDCLTPSGSFRIIRKSDENCISTVFPVRANGEGGGAIMPYCMHFWRGFALHGSEEVPGFAASHGCVRMFVQDARWLNEEFVDLPGSGGKTGTRVIIND